MFVVRAAEPSWRRTLGGSWSRQETRVCGPHGVWDWALPLPPTRKREREREKQRERERDRVR